MVLVYLIDSVDLSPYRDTTDTDTETLPVLRDPSLPDVDMSKNVALHHAVQLPMLETRSSAQQTAELRCHGPAQTIRYVPLLSPLDPPITKTNETSKCTYGMLVYVGAVTIADSTWYKKKKNERNPIASMMRLMYVWNMYNIKGSWVHV